MLLKEITIYFPKLIRFVYQLCFFMVSLLWSLLLSSIQSKIFLFSHTVSSQSSSLLNSLLWLNFKFFADFGVPCPVFQYLVLQLSYGNGIVDQSISKLDSSSEKAVNLLWNPQCLGHCLLHIKCQINTWKKCILMNQTQIHSNQHKHLNFYFGQETFLFKR